MKYEADLAKLRNINYYKEQMRSDIADQAASELVVLRHENAKFRAEIAHLWKENNAAWDSAGYNATRARTAEAEVKRLRGVVEALGHLDRLSYAGVTEKEKTGLTPDFAWIYAPHVDALTQECEQG